MTNSYLSFSEAYVGIIQDVLSKGAWVDGVKDPNSIGSNFGQSNRRTKEIIGYSFRVEHPYDRMPVLGRNINQQYLLANFLWILLGNNESKYILPFNDKGKLFSNERGEINSAIGPHIFKLSSGTYQELQRIEDILAADPTTRRAVIQLLESNDLTSQNKDIPCYNHLQFFLREDALHCLVVMRSQNAYGVLPYDFFLFSLLHEALCTRLSRNIGYIQFTCNSIHIYEDELARATNIVMDQRNQFELPRMSDFSDVTIENLKRFFHDLLHSIEFKNNPLPNLERYELDGYWREILFNHFYENS